MILQLRRTEFGEDYTCGDLFVDGKRVCYILEDRVRDLTKEKKVYGETAIPAGTYDISMKIKSPRYSAIKKFDFTGGFMPRLMNVKTHEGILIHTGNTPKDSLGCLLTGSTHVKGEAFVGKSMEAFRTLYNLLSAAKKGERITITISDER